jgi:hypothetical protein
VAFEAEVVPVFDAPEPGPLFGAAPCGVPALPCDTVVVGALGAFGAPAFPLPCAAAPVTPTEAMVSAAANV